MPTCAQRLTAIEGNSLVIRLLFLEFLRGAQRLTAIEGNSPRSIQVMGALALLVLNA